MVNAGTQANRIVSEDEYETKPIIARVENVNLPPQSPQLVQKQSLQQQNLGDVVLEQVPTQREMFEQLREMQNRLKSAEDALVEFKKKLVSRPGIKREADGPSGPPKKLKGSTQEAKWCGKCKSKHSGECSASTRKCMNCRKLGHIRHECNEDLRCYNCQKMGHISAVCPGKKVEEKKSDLEAGAVLFK